MSTFVSRYVDNFKRAFVTGAGVSPYQSLVGYSPGSDESWSPSKYGDYIATSSDIYIAANYRAKTLSSVPLKLYKGVGTKKTEVESGTLYEILQKVNPYWTARRLIQMSEMSLCLWGSAFWFMDRGQGGRGEPKEIWWARPDRVKVIPHPTEYISHFEYQTAGGQTIPFKREETVWFRYPNPIDEYSGLAPLAAARIAADTSSAAMRSNAMMFNNGLQLAGFVSPKMGEQWTQEQAEQIEESLKRRFQGANKAHRWAVLKRETQFMPLSISAKDAEYLGALEWSFETVCRVYGLSPDLLGGKTTFSNSAEARLALWEDTMKPECGFFSDEITEQLLPLFPGQADIAEFDFGSVEVLQEAEAAKWSRWKEQIEKGAKTVNEYREAIGDDPLVWGDDWWATASLVPIGGPMAVEAEAKAKEQADALAAQLEQDAKNEPVEDEQKPNPNEPRRFTRAMEYGGPDHERVWRAFVERSDKHEAKVKSTVQRLFKDQQKSIIAKLTGRSVREVNPENPFDKAAWIRKFREQMRPVLSQIIDDAGDAALKDINSAIGFDVKSPDAMRFLEQRVQRFAVQVNETTWTNLQASLVEGMDLGESIDDLAKRVESVMGERITSSAQTIARTETIGALNGGTQIAWDQSGVVAGKEWSAALDERTRETHVAAHGQIRKLNEDFDVGGGSGPMPGSIGSAEEDINCRCSTLPILDMDWEES